MINHDFQNLPDDYRLTESGPLPKEGQVMWLGSVEEERAEAERALREVLFQIGVMQENGN